MLTPQYLGGGALAVDVVAAEDGLVEALLPYKRQREVKGVDWLCSVRCMPYQPSNPVCSLDGRADTRVGVRHKHHAQRRDVEAAVRVELATHAPLHLRLEAQPLALKDEGLAVHRQGLLRPGEQGRVERHASVTSCAAGVPQALFRSF
eukprot:CAMPEP_0206231500 /NCGR_PEP_ID=MMETSP0047_2-20121206/10874_1 /ASSEMBLY_ACC=CAM_ASM_000192 /TAXON_ID=195065 /ORGANISM="Chroomonas mesostigmatica_cf, Strain CCMP1168" /LENGTH=147 /DNA_ID=CAMNT_0053655091 /DNA_START=632 /DNA_END=1073 /DNA_ORIENTATION=-